MMLSIPFAFTRASLSHFVRRQLELYVFVFFVLGFFFVADNDFVIALCATEQFDLAQFFVMPFKVPPLVSNDGGSLHQGDNSTLLSVQIMCLRLE